MVCEHVEKDYKQLKAFCERFCSKAIVRIQCPYCQTYYNVNK